MLSRCVSPTEKNTTKQLNWDYPPCAGFRKRYVGRIVASLKNAICSLCPICDPNPYNQKGYFKQKKWKRQRNKVITNWKKTFERCKIRLQVGQPWSLISLCCTEQLGAMFCHHSGDHAISWLNVVRHKKCDDHTLNLQLWCKKLSHPLNIC